MSEKATDETFKLQKILADAGLGSRRELERWITDGRVQLNGRVAKLGDRAKPTDRIFVDGNPLNADAETKPKTRVLLYNKPVGVICTRSDPEGRPTVFADLPPIKSGRWVNVGRLDVNTSGLMLFTNDGELANQLMHPSFQVEREYAVRVLGEADGQVLENLKKGVFLDDGIAKFERIVSGDGRGANHWYNVVLTEGRNREVRRLWESQGFTVNRLMRTRYAFIELPRNLRASKWVELPADELIRLQSLIAKKARQNKARAAKTK